MVLSPSTCPPTWHAVVNALVPSSIIVVPVSLSPPPPFPRITVRVPILSLLTEEYFRGRSARPCPAGPSLPVGRINVSSPCPCPPPSPPYSMAISSGLFSTLKGKDARRDHENTLPLGGRVYGHVQLYRERGRGGGWGRQRVGHRKKQTGNSSVDEGTLAQALPADASRDSRPSLGAPSTSPLHPHPSQVTPAAQVGGGGCKPADARQAPRRGHWLAVSRRAEDF